jgi:hypothetical protein
LAPLLMRHETKAPISESLGGRGLVPGVFALSKPCVIKPE